MSRSADAAAPPVARHSTRAAQVARAVLAVLAAIRVELRLRRDRRLLEALDERGLADLGLGPGGLEGAVRFGRDPGGTKASSKRPASAPAAR